MSAALETRPNAVTFDLEDLVVKAWAGHIRIPHFQRPFRWGRDDVLRLLDSVVRGYPIGSLLLWARRGDKQALTLGSLHVDAPAVDRALWVVDGQQRITSLANALHPVAAKDARFALGYDLRVQRFVALRGAESSAVLPLPVLFDLEEVLGWFAERPDIGHQLKAATAITKALRQYKVPAYLVEQDNIEILQDIFDRLNNYGKRLSRAEVFTALNAGSEQDAGLRLTPASIAEDVDSELAFGVLDDATVVKAILARRHPDVLRDIRGEFSDRAGVDFPEESRDAAFEAARSALLRAVTFLQNQAGVPHVGFLPYRDPLVVLVRFLAHHPDPDERNQRLLRRWFWRVTATGDAAAGSTAVRAHCAAVRPGDLAGSVRRLLDLAGSTPGRQPDLGRFRTNAANTKMVLCAWWADEPRSLLTAKPLDQSILAECLAGQRTAADAVRHIVPPSMVSGLLRQSAANRILAPDLVVIDVSGFVQFRSDAHADGHGWPGVLESHSITDEMLALLQDQRIDDFVRRRHDLLGGRFGAFLSRMCEWDFEDTPSLADLILDEDDEDDEDDA